MFVKTDLYLHNLDNVTFHLGATYMEFTSFIKNKLIVKPANTIDVANSSRFIGIISASAPPKAYQEA